MSETTVTAEQVVLDAFAEYWRANYCDDCVISSREWHLPKLQRAIRHALRPVLTTEVVRREKAEQENERLREADRNSRAAIGLIARTYCDEWGNPIHEMPQIVQQISDILCIGVKDLAAFDEARAAIAAKEVRG